MTKEQIIQAFKNACATIKKLAEAIAKVIQELLRSIKKCFRDWVVSMARIPKRQRNYQTSRFLYYGSIIAGMSNNWRKMHRIPMVRSRP